MTVGLHIRAVRKRRGLTLEELSGLCGVSRDDLGEYERGEMSPRADTVRKIADALRVPVTAIRNGMGWTAPQPQEDWETAGDAAPLYDGILESLREAYGGVDRDGADGFLIGPPQEQFSLDESDIVALMDSVKASIPALIEYMKDTRPETEIHGEILEELHSVPEDAEEELIRLNRLTDEEWEAVRGLLPPENAGKGRAFKSNRLMLDGILYRLKTGRSWRSLPACYGRYKCVADRLRLWSGAGVWDAVLEKLLELGVLDEAAANRSSLAAEERK